MHHDLGSLGTGQELIAWNATGDHGSTQPPIEAPSLPSPQHPVLLPQSPLLAPLLESYVDCLNARKVTAHHANSTRRQIREILDLGEITTLQTLRLDRVNRALGKLTAGTPTRKAVSLRTANQFIQSIKGFARWLEDYEHVARNPLRLLKPLKAGRDRRHVRRNLTEAEFGKLFDVTLCGPDGMPRKYLGVHAIDRAHLYIAAVATGLRARALRLLRVEQFQLDGLRPCVAVEGDQEKAGTDRIVPISAWAVPLLRSYLCQKMPFARAFAMPHRCGVARMLRRDLADAGINPFIRVEVEGQPVRRRNVVDFHSLRGTCGQWMMDRGASVKDVQIQLGHSSPVVTMNSYLHAGRPDQTRSIDLAQPPLRKIS